MRKLLKLGGLFDLENKNKEISKLKKQIESPDFWNDKNTSNEIIKKFNALKNITDNINRLNKLYNEPLEFLIDKENIYIKD